MAVAGSKRSRAEAEVHPAPFENPLTPNKKLRALYRSMVELRLLEARAGELQKTSKRKPLPAAAPREEACRVSTAIDLEPGDLSSDARSGVATEFLRGAKLSDLLHRARTASSNPAKPLAAPDKTRPRNQLPLTARALDRLHLAVGAACALKAARSSGEGNLVLAYAYPDDLSLAAWKQLLQLVGAQHVPLILTLLPNPSASKRAVHLAHLGRISRLATGSGVPGIMVDAADPVAVYRVTQEAMERARAGGGAMLMECVPFVLPGQSAADTDPLRVMEKFLLARRLVSTAWKTQLHTRFATRLKNAGR